MSDMPPTPQFEEEICVALYVPAAREEFINNLQSQIMQRASKTPNVNRLVFLRPAWVIAIIIAVISISILAIGPQRVIAAMQELFGYVPGVGIVDKSAPFRVLAEQVNVTRDGITVTVTSALLTGQKTHIEYRIFGVQVSAYPNREDVMGCTTPEYLRLPDGSQIKRIDNDFGPVPAGINTATFVMPCIFNTLPGKTTENWELPLRFVPAPPDLTVVPVIDLSPSPQASLTPEPTAQVEASGAASIPMANNQITIIKEIQTSDGYILVAQLPFQGPPGEKVANGKAEIRDANGKKVDFTSPKDVGPNSLGLDPNGPYWFMQFKTLGLAYPLTFTLSGDAIQQADPKATTQFTFDAGSNPQPGQEWSPNQDIQLAGHTLKLIAINVRSRNGYNFRFQGAPTVISADIQIDGYSATGHGWGRGFDAGGFDTSLTFVQLPTGILKVTLSNLVVTGETLTWQGHWSPGTPRTDLPANPTPQPGLCLTTDAISQLKSVPTSLANWKALVYEKIDDTGKWGLVLYSLDGSQKKVVVPEGNWGALSPDGRQVAYSGLDNGIHLVDVNSMTDRSIPNASGFNIQWSPDGTQIAYIGLGKGTVNSAFIAKTDGTMVRQVSNLSYETIIGWSPEGAQLYFAVPFTGGAAWKVYSYDITKGSAQERFTIENGSPKFLNPKLSPDGKWIAYRGRDNSSIYAVHPDGSDTHLVLDKVDAVGIEWSLSGWLGVSLNHPNSDQSTLVMLKPVGCVSYLLSTTLHGDLEGLFIP